MVNEVSGLNLSIGENGGTTAADLGIRTFSVGTLLADLNVGRGVAGSYGENDFEIRLRNGSSFQVNIDSVVSVGDLIGAVEAAAVGAGLTVGPGGDINVALVGDGNGLLLEDGTAGAAQFAVADLGMSRAADHLGIAGTAAPGAGGGTIVGRDVAQVRVASAFTFLIDLRDSLANSDGRGITFAGEDLETAMDRLGRSRAEVALNAQRSEQELERSAQVRISEESLLSDLQDADMTAVITRFSQLQAQLQATLQTGSYSMQLSLLDFLR